MILGLHWWAFCLLCLVPFVFPGIACILDSSNSFIHKSREWKRMKVGDMYVHAYYSEKRMEERQGGHKIHIIVTKKGGTKPNDWRVYYDYFCDGKKLGEGNMKVNKSMLKFFDNFRRPDDFSCILYLWAKKYKGNGYY